MDALTELNNALAELHLTDVFKKYGAGPIYDVTHTGKAEIHINNAIRYLTPIQPPTPTTPSMRVVVIPPIPANAIKVSTTSSFSAALANAKDGDVIDATTFVSSSEFTLTCKAKASVYLGKFTDGGSLYLPAIYVKNSGRPGANLTLYGGNVSNPNGDGIRYQDSFVTHYGFTVHGCALQGILAVCVGSNAELDLDGDMTNNGTRWRDLDPHRALEPGTGLHSCYLGSRASTSLPYSLKFKASLRVTDQPAGAALQIGDAVSSGEYWVDARRITFQAQKQVAGNAVQYWGGLLNNIVGHYIYGEDLAGRVVETDGLYGGSNLIVEYARATRVRLTPAYAPKVPYLPPSAFIDCKIF